MTQEEQISPSAARKAPGPLLDRSSSSVDRLPGLVVIFDQFATSLSEGLAPLCRSAASFSVDKIESAGLFEMLAERQGLLAAVLHSEELDAHALVIFDRRLVAAFAHTAFGGGANEPANRESNNFPDRPCTTIETSLVEKIAQLSARALDAGFVGVAAPAFTFVRQEAIVDSQILGRRDMPMLAAHIAFEAPGGRGALIALIPQAVLLPMRQTLSRDPWSAAAAADPRWAKEMQAGVSSTHIPVKGVLEKLEMTLGEVGNFALGQVLDLHGSGMGRVMLECGGRSMYWCKLGQSEGRYILEIENPIEQERGPLEEMLAN